MIKVIVLLLSILNLVVNNHIIMEDDTNTILRMLNKGEKNMGNYKGFDYSVLSPASLSMISHLTFFSKYKHLIVSYFKSSKVSPDVKVTFLEQNSMKLGAKIFNRVEVARLDYNYAVESSPYIAGGFAFMFFLGFAWFSPMTSKLYKELGYSMAMGGSISIGWAFKKKFLYLHEVNEAYYVMKKRFDAHPEFAETKEDDSILKNFG